ncbi:MAG TPA: DUF4118 domain-containing protein [Chloroflexota bacterium]|nr:DUF4118 domain-containing protein [Chloroflexota bacterium]
MNITTGWSVPLPARGELIGFALAVLAASGSTAGLVALDHFVRIPNGSLLYLPVVLVVAVTFGMRPSLLAATIAVLEYDFFLLRPLYTFGIARIEDILAFVVFVVVAVLTSQLAARARERAEAAQRRATESTTLYELGRALMSARHVDDVLHAITQRIVDVFHVDRCAIYVPGSDSRLVLAAQTVAGGTQDRASHATVHWAFQQGTQVTLPEGESSHGTLDQERQRLFVPLRTADRVVGVMEIGRKRAPRERVTGDSQLDADERRLVTSFAAQATLVIMQAAGEEERNRLRIIEESDRLKSTLLNAVSHDLRTPLASIKASATALLLADVPWSREQGRELLQAIDQEADRLNRLVGNLLDLSRIEAGVLRPVLDWYDMQEVVDGVLPRLQAVLGDRPFVVDVQPGIPLVQFDLLRIEELIVNLFDNAVKYTPSGSPLELRVRHDSGGLILKVIDHGPGVSDASRIFEAFYQGRLHGDDQPGTGLGLAICRGVAEAHGGHLHVETTPGGGATFVLTLPPVHAGDTVPV